MPPEFSLQSVLDFRHSQVEALEIQFGQLLAAQKREQELLEGLRAGRDELFEALRSEQAGVINLGAVAQLRLNVKRIENQITQQQQLLAGLAQQVEAHRQKLIVARQDEEALAILKRKELARLRAEQLRQENNLQADIYILQAYRRASAGSGSAAG